MSLKNTKEVLRRFRNFAEDDDERVASEALAEVEALERATVALYEHGLIDEGVTEGAEDATATMRRIVEEAAS